MLPQEAQVQVVLQERLDLVVLQEPAALQAPQAALPQKITGVKLVQQMMTAEQMLRLAVRRQGRRVVLVRRRVATRIRRFALMVTPV